MQAFINFVEPGSAYHLMMNTGGQVLLAGKHLAIMWAKMRPLPRDLIAAIRQGATRNLYVANAPESLTEELATSLFAPFGGERALDILSLLFSSRTLLGSLRAKSLDPCLDGPTPLLIGSQRSSRSASSARREPPLSTTPTSPRPSKPRTRCTARCEFTRGRNALLLDSSLAYLASSMPLLLPGIQLQTQKGLGSGLGLWLGLKLA
mgnify:CR=1 FL=1